MEIFARDSEIKELNRFLKSPKAEFIAVYGRRRVGKTYLIRNFFETRSRLFFLTGIPEANTQQNLLNFNEEYADVFTRGIAQEVPNNWHEAFTRLRKKIEERKIRKKTVIFLDELPWLSGHKSGFIEALSLFWNRYLSNNPQIILIVCGSAASWMINNMIDAKGSLHNRLTGKIRLLPFNLRETEIYLKKNRINLDQKQIIEIYMAIGGVAAYLNYLEKGKSSKQLISEVCLSHNSSSLYGEFDRLFKSLFSKSELHVSVVKALAERRIGLTRSEIIEKTGLTSGSVFNRVTNELIESGFVSKMPLFGNIKKGSTYRLTDEYSLFYLKWYKKIKNTRVNNSTNYWQTLLNTRSYTSWAGFSFEGICLNHVNEIAKALGISGTLYTYSNWYYKPKKKGEKGAQIDLVIDRPDNAINLCEIKFTDREFVITKKYAEELKYKIEIFREKTQTKKTVFFSFITPYGIKKNDYSIDIVDNEVLMENLFK